ncbi:MAG: hypothetical protein WC866_00665 [Patescibacteria group bacterium]|jgi:hypothetical protein
MKRSTFSLLLTIALLAACAVLWLLFIAPRFGLPPYGKKTPVTPVISTPETPEKARNSALNLYLAPPSALPDNASRAELTLVKATVVDASGASTEFFSGVQRVMLQPGSVQKVLSERIPDGRWTRLTLEFSPAAELAYADGNVKAALMGKKIISFTFDATVGISRSLAVFGIVPLEREVIVAEKALVANLNADPIPGQTYVFGGFLLEPRGRGDIFNITNPTLISVVKEDLGFDLTIVKTGSSGFQPATQPAP